DTDAVAATLARTEANRVVFMRRMIGFCFALQRRVWEEIGAFDEGFGVGHYEDDDLCLRLERQGYLAAAAPDVYVHHYASQSFEGAGIDTLASVRQKAFLFYKKWGNAYLDWPDLRGNLCDALHVVARTQGGNGPLPAWRPGALPFLLSCVCPGASSAAIAA